MKGIFVLALLLSLTILLKAQTYNRKPLEVDNLIKGLENMDHLRPQLIEKGFKYRENTRLGEHWSVTIDFNGIHSDNSTVLLAVSSTFWSEDIKSISLYINPELINYKEAFEKELKKVFPKKKAVKKEKFDSNGNSKEIYVLIYSNDSNIEIEYSEDVFITYIFRNYRN